MRRDAKCLKPMSPALKSSPSYRAAYRLSITSTGGIPMQCSARLQQRLYQRNLDTLRGNGANFAQDDAAQVVRGGQGLLSGLLRCARCARKLNIRYWGKQGTAARYLCSGDFQTGGRYCLGFGGATVGRRLSEVILHALSPYGLQASLAAITQSRSQCSERRGVLERQLQQARYEAERAFAQYDQIDPGNRLVAEVLEQRWNAKLAEQQRVAQALGDLNDARVGGGLCLGLAERRLSHDVEETHRAHPHQGDRR